MEILLNHKNIEPGKKYADVKTENKNLDQFIVVGLNNNWYVL